MNALPLQIVMLLFAGTVNRDQLDVIEYLQEGKRALREVSQIARNLTDCGAGFLKDARHRIHDRDPDVWRDSAYARPR